MTRLSIPLAVVGSSVVLIGAAWSLDAAIGLSVAAMLFEAGGLAIIARWVVVDLHALLTGKQSLGFHSFGTDFSAFHLTPSPETTDEALKRLEGELVTLRTAMREGENKLRARIDELDRGISTRIEAATDPRLGLVLIIGGVFLSAAANIVSSWPS